MYEAIPLWKQVILEKLSNAIGKTTLLVLEYPHCLLMANCDDPYGRVCPTYIISFITLDASCPW